MDKYTGAIAAHYLDKRPLSWKWRFEQDAVQEFLTILKPGTVLDAPVGTGRFAPIYKQLGISATGLDISQDMLSQVEGMPTVCGDILTHSGDYDCVVCIRLLNWFNTDKLFQALENIARIGRHAVISITTAEKAFTWHTGAHIHAESDVLGKIKDCGWIVSDSRSASLDKGATAWMMVLDPN